MRTMRIIIAEDHVVVRQGLKAMLNECKSFEIIGEAGDGGRAVRLTRRLKPDLVLMDLEMPTMNGLEATRALRASNPEVKVLVLSSFSDEDLAFQALEAGANGYLTKHAASEQLIEALKQISEGETYIAPSIADKLVRRSEGHFANGCALTNRRNQLSAREKEVLGLIAHGLSNKEIATRLWLSVKTVEKHRHQVMAKLNIHETAGLTRYAFNKGLISIGTRAAA
jgi:DNA-binding NarL/FixJ family response regulator